MPSPRQLRTAQLRLPRRAHLDLLPADPAAAPGSPAPEKRWTLSSGAPVVTVIKGLNGDRPITLIIDLATLRLPASCLALYDHRDGLHEDEECGYVLPAVVIGAWEDLRIDQIDGLPALTAQPRWIILPPAPADAYDPWHEHREILDLIAQRMPVQASVGVCENPSVAGSQFVLLAATETINGRPMEPSTDQPVYVGRNLDIYEASALLYGADGRTGAQLRARLNAPKPPTTTVPPKELPMSDRLAALLAKHHDSTHGLIAKLVAANKTDLEIDGEIHKAQLAAKDGEITELKAQLGTRDTEIGSLKAQLAKAGVQPAKLPAGASESTETEEETAAPANLQAALAHPDVAHLKGDARLAAVRQAWPQFARG